MRHRRARKRCSSCGSLKPRSDYARGSVVCGDCLIAVSHGISRPTSELLGLGLCRRHELPGNDEIPRTSRSGG